MNSIMQEAGAKIKRVAELLNESEENVIALIAVRYSGEYLRHIEMMVEERNLINQEGERS